LMFSFLAVGFSLYSCLGEFNDLDKIKGFKWEPQIAIPIINSDFDFYDFVEHSAAKDYVTSDPNGVITFVYDNGILTKTGQSIYTIENQNYQSSEEIPFATTSQLPLLDSIVYTKKIIYAFTTSPGRELDSVFLKAGQLNFQTNWNFSQPGKVFIKFNSLTKNADTVRLSRQFSSSNPAFNSTIDLSTAQVDLSDKGSTFNKFALTFTWIIYNDGNPLPSPTNFNINLQLTSLQWRGIFGELGTETFNTAVSNTTFDFFDVLSSGTFELDNPKATIYFDNTFGVAANLDLNNIWVENSLGAKRVQGTIMANPVVIDGITYDQLGTKNTTSVEINSSNSNLADLIKDIPKSITSGFSGTANGISGKEFVMDTSHIDVNLKLELPFSGKIIGLTADKNYSFDGTGLENVKNVTLEMNSTNELPFEIALQIYFLDSLGNTVETLFNNNSVILEASDNAADGTVITPGKNTTEIILNETQLNNMSGATQIKMIAVINSYQSGTVPVTVYDLQKVKFTVGLHTTLNPTNN